MNSNPTCSNRSDLILAVDDNPTYVELIRRILVENGYTVRTALNVDQALAVMKDIIPALLILDVMMPGKSGYDLCKSVKQDSRLKDIPVVFLSGRDSAEDVKMGHEAGAVLYLSKLCGLDSLLRVVHRLCPARIKSGDTS